jgi:nickel-dependent lactate racemase
MITPAFAVNTIVNERGEITDLYCGHWISSHRAACEAYAGSHTIEIEDKRDLVVVSCGGYPFDINLIQAHKALDAASHACNEGGTIILLADCEDGLGRSDLMKWFAVSNSNELAKLLCEKYQVNGQTAWSFLTKAERFDIKMVTSLPGDQVEAKRAIKIDLSAINDALGHSKGGYILPAGSHLQIRSQVG